ncbi:MAG TPA: RNA methyltransferase [Chlamydiales bacterium]|nr:RNA methyltransferase [Chlamydiales bacterium]
MITSLQNSRVKLCVALRDRRSRKDTGLFLIEGYREITRAIDAGRTIETLLICPELFLGEKNEELIKKCGGEVLECTPEVFAKISYRDRPDGLLALAPQLHLGLEELKLSKNPFFLVAESIEKPGNLGTILRSSDAAGVDAVIVCDPTTDIHNPNVVRSSIGTLFTLPVLEAGSEETLQYLKKQNIALVAATPHAEKEYTEVDLTVPLAIVVGTEQYGLSENWMKQADTLVRIPMCGVADSLNVASATTLMLYEVLRQRRNSLQR